MINIKSLQNPKTGYIHQKGLMEIVSGGVTIPVPNVRTVLSNLDVADTGGPINYIVGQLLISLGDHVNIDNIRGAIDNAIRSYTANLGYEVNFSADDVETLLKTSVELFSFIVSFHRSQTGKNLVDHITGTDLGGMFFKMRPNNLNGDYYNNPTNVDFVSGVVDYGTQNLSNAEWVQTYLEPLSRVYLNQELVDLAKYLFEGVFSEASHDAKRGFFRMFIPGAVGSMTATGATDVAALIVSHSNAIKALKAAHPSLDPFMKYLGFDPKFAMDCDFTRDLSGRTLIEKFSNDMEVMLVNSHYDAEQFPSALEYDEDDKRIYTFNAKHLYDQPYASMEQITLNDFKRMDLLRALNPISLMSAIVSYDETTDVFSLAYFDPCRIPAFSGGVWTFADLQGLLDSAIIWNYAMGIQEDVAFKVDDTSATQFKSQATGNNLYIAEYEQYRKMYQAQMLFGSDYHAFLAAKGTNTYKQPIK